MESLKIKIMDVHDNVPECELTGVAIDGLDARDITLFAPRYRELRPKPQAGAFQIYPDEPTHGERLEEQVFGADGVTSTSDDMNKASRGFMIFSVVAVLSISALALYYHKLSK